MSEFEKRFPKPEVEYKDESYNFISTMNILYDKKREGWLEALKWAKTQKVSTIAHYDAISTCKIVDEIEELEDEKTT